MARRRKPAAREQAQESRRRPNLGGLLILVAIFAGVWLPDGVTFRVLGPWLESLGGWQRAVVGVLVGAAAASPWVLQLAPRVWRWGRIPAQTLVAAAGAWLLTVWLPPKSYNGTGVRQELFRARAEWYIATSVVTFLAVLVLVLVADFRADRRRTTAVHEEHMAAVRRELAAGRGRRGR
ncbi:hypothetical protein SAMN05660662_0605 [Blastococcus aurantiacus]|uniref:Transmembrane protein n=1 Tax=Blastococcus aurantiacus TaxID=1550231 RepID=A0A1G7HH24_9ACTN|nr:hypothetical protein [Blastococcus aurantiacus]SDE99626.1 hypothetical protein SAMN05660662_0605 [Blastococcus aurantiacus]